MSPQWPSLLSCFPILTLRLRQYGRHFANDTFKRIFFNENVIISIEFSLTFIPMGPIKNIPALVQIMAWRRPGDKPLSESMMVSLPTHICVPRPQWVKVRLLQLFWRSGTCRWNLWVVACLILTRMTGYQDFSIGPVSWSFDAFFVMSLNNLLNKQLSCHWFEMPRHLCENPAMFIPYGVTIWATIHYIYDFYAITCRKISNITCTESPNLSASRLVMQLYLPNPVKPGVKWRMKM